MIFKHVVIVKHTHTLSGGVELELLEYLKGKAAGIAYISHPFPDARSDVPLNTTVNFFDHAGELLQEIKAPLISGPRILFYIKDVLFTLYFLWRAHRKFDLYIGVDGLNAFTGLILKKLGIVDTVVFYVIDYVPRRFKNRLLNTIYHLIDKICCYHCHCVWNVSPLMVEAREEAGISKNRCAPQITVPLGCHFESIKRLPIGRINRHAIVYLGNLSEEQGVRLIIEAMPEIVAEVPDAKLVVVGSGKLREALEQRAVISGVEKHIHFCGFVVDDKEVERILSRCAVGLAPYPEDVIGYKQFCDPAKVKIYMACGLPVIITRVPLIARDIERRRAGTVIQYKKKQLVRSVVRSLSDDEFYMMCREEAIEFASKFEWENVFSEALDSTFGRGRGHV